MARRIGLSLAELRKLDPSACDTDARLVWKDGEETSLSIVVMSTPNPKLVVELYVSSARELRLLGAQMIRYAEELERGPDTFEVVIP